MPKLKKVVLVSLIVTFICWSTMVIIDFQCGTQAKKPVFAVPTHVTDCSMYRGLGYTITLRYEGEIGRPREKLKGYFSWGWH